MPSLISDRNMKALETALGTGHSQAYMGVCFTVLWDDLAARTFEN